MATKTKLTAADKLKRAEEAFSKAKKVAEGERIVQELKNINADGGLDCSNFWKVIRAKTNTKDDLLLLNEFIKAAGIKGIHAVKKPPAKKKETTEEVTAEAPAEMPLAA